MNKHLLEAPPKIQFSEEKAISPKKRIKMRSPNLDGELFPPSRINQAKTMIMRRQPVHYQRKINPMQRTSSMHVTAQREEPLSKMRATI